MLRVLLAGLLLCLSATSQAALLGRAPLTQGGSDYQAYYDDALNITWLQDGTYAKTSGYDSNVLMTWFDAQAWLGSLNSSQLLGLSDWRLPSMDVNGDAIVVKCSIATEFECRDNELGYLTFIYGITPTDNGVFKNVDHNYWSSTDYNAITDGWPDGWTCYGGPSGPCAWRQGFSADSQNYVAKDYDGYSVWAVSSGDPLAASVPLPAAFWLFGGAFGALGIAKRRAQA